jgi:hypothetical protein
MPKNTRPREFFSTRTFFAFVNLTLGLLLMRDGIPHRDECMALKEVKSLRKMKHPNIVKLKEVREET